MNSIELTNRWMEAVGDRLNPILVKETRQALKSKQFIVTFLLVLTISWLVATVGMLVVSDQIEYGAASRGFFYLFYLVLAPALFLVVPFSAYRSLLSERDENTYDLLSITTLEPRQIVWGKLLSALVQLFIYCSATAPFIAFTSLLEGFDMAQVLFLLVYAQLASLGACALALLMASMAQQKHWQVVNALVLLGALMFLGCTTLFGVAPGVLMNQLEVDDPDFWWAVGFSLVAYATYFVLALQITTAQLTFESANRSTGIRVTAFVQFVLLWAALLVYLDGSGTRLDRDMVGVVTMLSSLHWAVVGLFVATEEGHLSRRIARSLPRQPLGRLLLVPFMPGGGTGFLFVVMNLLLTLACAAGVMWYFEPPLSGRWYAVVSNDWEEMFRMCVCMACYAVFYIGMGSAAGRWIRRWTPDFRAGHARVTTLILFLAFCLLPHVPDVLGLHRGGGYYSLLYVTEPFSSLGEVERNSGNSESITLFVVCGAMLAVILNLAAMRQGVLEVLSADASPARTAPPRLAADPIVTT